MLQDTHTEKFGEVALLTSFITAELVLYFRHVADVLRHPQVDRKDLQELGNRKAKLLLFLHMSPPVCMFHKISSHHSEPIAACRPRPDYCTFASEGAVALPHGFPSNFCMVRRAILTTPYMRSQACSLNSSSYGSWA